MRDLLVCSVDAFAEERDVIAFPDLVIPVACADTIA
jgi:hypothetical protein